MACGDDPKESNVLPRLLDEREAAALLRVKRATVRGERIRRRLGYIRVGVRIFYTLELIAEYLERQSVQACASDGQSDPDRSAPTGSAGSPAAMGATMPGAAPGTTFARDRHAVSALARQTFARRVSSSRRGSSATSDPATPPQTKS